MSCKTHQGLGLKHRHDSMMEKLRMSMSISAGNQSDRDSGAPIMLTTEAGT